MVETISQGTKKARKPHQCFHCYRQIGYDDRHGFKVKVNRQDGSVYTLRWHRDCKECADEYRDYGDYPLLEGEDFPPLREYFLSSGMYQWELNYLRGFYPHVVARMELTDQLFDQHLETNK